MKATYHLLFFVVLLIPAWSGQAQTCSCTISEVENNTVQPCDRIVGVVDTVSTTQELKSAIIQANASGGDRTILLENGTYSIASPTWYPYITASNVVFRSLSGNRDSVIITGTGMGSVAPATENGFYFVGNNNTIADLTIREVGNHGIALHGDSLVVYNVKIQNTYEQMLKGTSAGDGADDCRVLCSLFEYPAGVGPQFYIGGLDIHEGNNWIVRDNVFKHIASPSGSIAQHAIHFWNNSANNIVERNVIVNCDRGIGFGLGGSANDGGIIRNNMIYNDGSGLFNDVGIALETSPNAKIYNNTVYVAYPNAIEYRFAATTNVQIANNLTNGIIKSRDGGVANLTTNYTGVPNDWFEDLPAGNLRLNSYYPEVVDAGTTVTEVTEDIDQTPRPQAAFFDIGAFEQIVTRVQTLESSTPRISVFPNPAIHSFSIKSEIPYTANVTIFNRMGQKVAGFEDVQLSPEFVVDVSEWEPGLYVCYISGTNQLPRTIRIFVIK